MGGGRKLEFDRQQALLAAMKVFWQKGYLGAALSDLTDAMGINKPSLYATFGNKEALFLQATQSYLDSIRAQSDILQQAGLALRERLERFLTATVTSQCDDETPKGCYVSVCMTEVASDSMPDAAKEIITKAASATHAALVSLLQTDKEAVALGLDQQAEQHALMLVTFLQGSAAMTRAGRSLEEMKPVLRKTLDAIGVTQTEHNSANWS